MKRYSTPRIHPKELIQYQSLHLPPTSWKCESYKQPKTGSFNKVDEVSFADPVASEKVLKWAKKRLKFTSGMPLICILVGASGTGKSFIIDYVCRIGGTQPFVISLEQKQEMLQAKNSSLPNLERIMTVNSFQRTTIVLEDVDEYPEKWMKQFCKTFIGRYNLQRTLPIIFMTAHSLFSKNQYKRLLVDTKCAELVQFKPIAPKRCEMFIKRWTPNWTQKQRNDLMDDLYNKVDPFDRHKIPQDLSQVLIRLRSFGLGSKKDESVEDVFTYVSKVLRKDTDWGVEGKKTEDKKKGEKYLELKNGEKEKLMGYGETYWDTMERKYVQFGDSQMFMQDLLHNNAMVYAKAIHDVSDTSDAYSDADLLTKDFSLKNENPELESCARILKTVGIGTCRPVGKLQISKKKTKNEAKYDKKTLGVKMSEV